MTASSPSEYVRPKQPRWRLALACAALALAAILAGCGLPASASGNLSSTNGPVTLTVVHQTGTQALTITIVVANHTQKPMTWNGGCGRPYYVFLRKTNDDIVQRWPSIQTGLVCRAITVVSLNPGKSETLGVVNTNDASSTGGATIPAGTYNVSVDFTFQQYDGGGPTTVSTGMPLSW